MKIKDFMQELYDWTDNDASHYEVTCDIIKAGDPEQELTKIAVSMFPTPDVIRQAAAWGANLLIVHEPTFYDHWDSYETMEKTTGFKRQILDLKRKFIADHNMTIYRYHDHPHYRVPDMISEGMMRDAGLDGSWSRGSFYGVSRFELNEPMNLQDLVSTLEKNWNIQRIRIVGANDQPVKKLSLCFGTPGHLEDELGECDVVLTGEIVEWMTGEFAKDCTQMGIPKTVLVMGHTCSERNGMMLLADLIPQQWSEFDVKYFESGDCYTFGK